MIFPAPFGRIWRVLILDKMKEKISVVKVCIEDFGTIHMRFNRHYDRGHIQRLTDYITYAMERWQTEVMKIEKIKKYEPNNNNCQ